MLVEQSTENPRVGGSIPPLGTIIQIPRKRHILLEIQSRTVLVKLLSYKGPLLRHSVPFYSGGLA